MNRPLLSAMTRAGLACVVMAAGGASAEDTQASSNGDTAETRAVHGEVKTVDSVHNALELSNGHELTLDPSTPITKDGEIASLKDIEQGDDVWASFAPGSTSKVHELTAATPARQVLDGIPQSAEQVFLHDTWTSGGS
jgi:hypothetical protein